MSVVRRPCGKFMATVYDRRLGRKRYVGVFEEKADAYAAVAEVQAVPIEDWDDILGATRSRWAAAKPMEWPAAFWRYVNKNGPNGCWVWIGTILPAGGYGRIRPPGSDYRVAHRLSYELVVGPIPEGLVLDHLCRNPQCVNPEHLEPVTLVENTRRGFEARTDETVERYRVALGRISALGVGEASEIARVALHTGAPPKWPRYPKAEAA